MKYTHPFLVLIKIKEIKKLVFPSDFAIEIFLTIKFRYKIKNYNGTKEKIFYNFDGQKLLFLFFHF